jgi:glycosyltransferase involved in cell wall biosynthesis
VDDSKKEKQQMNKLKKIRVAITYRVCQNWRAPIFARIAKSSDIELMVFHGGDIPGTKLINDRVFQGVPHKKLITFYFNLHSAGRKTTWIIYPSILYHLTRFRPDVLLCEGGSNIFNNFLIYVWALFARVPTIWWTLGYLPGRKYQGISALYVKLSDFLMRRSSVLLGYSSRAKRYFQMRRCHQPQFVSVNCVDTDKVFERIRIAMEQLLDVRSKFKINGKQVILFVGALTREKRVDDLINAYKIIRRKRKNLALLIVGDGDDKERLKALVASSRIADVHFAGRIIDKISHYFLTANIFVLPGLGGLAISEAMAHGLPIICTVADGCEEDLIKPLKNGVIVQEGDIISLGEAIQTLLDDPLKLKTMGNMSLNMIRTKYNVHTYLQNIMSAIKCAVQSQHRGAISISKQED